MLLLKIVSIIIKVIYCPACCGMDWSGITESV